MLTHGALKSGRVFYSLAEDFDKKTEGGNVLFVVVCEVENSHFCCCRNSNAYLLQKSLTFLCLLVNWKNLLVNAHN